MAVVLVMGLFQFGNCNTLFSFISSQQGIKKQLEINDRYYLKMDESALSEKNHFARYTDWLAYAAGFTFFVAIVCSTIFVSINLERIAIMVDKKQAYAPTPTIQQTHKTEQKGAPVPGIQQVPQQTTQSTGFTAATSKSETPASSNTNRNEKP